MGCGLGARRGGIQSLLTLLGNEGHREALEYDLIALGLRLDDLGTVALSWRDLWVIYRQSPPGAAIVAATNPDAVWGLPEQLLAAVVDSLRVANWQRGRAKRHEYPRPLPRPGVEPEATTIGTDAVSMDEMADFLGWSGAMTPWRPQPDETEAPDE